jgi:receptor protein-tyrosine kinase
MGRLDNAMRRAAEERAAKSVTTLDDQPLPAPDFPSEEPELPRRTVVAHTGPARVELLPPPAAEQQPVDPPARHRCRPRPRRPLQRFHLLRLSLLSRRRRSWALVRRRCSSRWIPVWPPRTVVDSTMLPASREQYRRLAAALHQAQRTNGFKVAMVASAVAGEGKTLTASNLALTLSESYRRNVLLVDGDLRRPSLHTVFQVDGAPGLSDGLTSAEEPKLPLHRISPRLTVLPAGRPTSDPIGALTSDRMRRLIEEAREVFDWVILDTPPIGLLTDAALLSSMADGVVLVIKAGSTQYDMVNRAVDLIGRDRLLGVVLNRATEMPNRSTYDYSKYYYSANTTELPAKNDRT